MTNPRMALCSVEALGKGVKYTLPRLDLSACLGSLQVPWIGSEHEEIHLPVSYRECRAGR